MAAEPYNRDCAFVMEIPYAIEKRYCDPTLAHGDDAGWDLYAAEKCEIPPLSFETVSLGIRVDIPKGYFGMLCSRSGMACEGIGLVNGVGIIDSGYTGTVKATLFNYGRDAYEISCGDRIAQLIIMPYGGFDYAGVHPKLSASNNNWMSFSDDKVAEQYDKWVKQNRSPLDQQLIHPLPSMYEVSSGYFDSLSEKSDRGNDGFGSTGKNVWDELRNRCRVSTTGA